MAEIRLTIPGEDCRDLLVQVAAFEQQWDNGMAVGQIQLLVDKIVEQIRCYLVAEGFESTDGLGLEQLDGVLDCFYLDMAFSSTMQDMPESQLNSLSYLLQYHTGEGLSMSILLNHVLSAVGFASKVAIINQELMIKVDLCDQQFAIVDAVSGEQHTHHKLACASVLPDSWAMECRELDRFNLLQIYLTQQKMAFTRELQFDKALSCIELLMETTPNDPYQRRDRGFVLHQLDCFDHARNDFEFFIDHCPEDPAAQMLKVQLEDFEQPTHTLH